jgi:putative two-component system response regulator
VHFIVDSIVEGAQTLRPQIAAPGVRPNLPAREPEHLLGARILAVDDQSTNLELLALILRGAGYSDLRLITDPRAAVAEYRVYQPDLILLDLHMPHMDGMQVMADLAPFIGSEYLPILVLTGDPSSEAKQSALSIGAKDFVTKPFGRGEVLLRIRNLLETRFLYKQLQRHNAALEVAVRDRTRELEETQIEILERLAIAAEYRDDDTGQHAQRVGEISGQIARQLGLPAPEVELIRRAALLHDVGKIGIPDHILLKSGRYTAEERQQMAAHTTIGARIVSGSRSPLLRLAETVCLTHHHHWDGGPSGNVTGDAIPLPGRIVAVADVFDALTHSRPYKAAWPIEEATAEIVRQSARQFDPAVVEAFQTALKTGALPVELLSAA